MSIDREIAELKRRVKDVEGRTQNIPVRFAASGGGGLKIRAYTTFPVIPTVYTLISIDGQIWAAGPDDTAWYPIYKFTLTDGEPESTP